jgi:hypothetical protein
LKTQNVTSRKQHIRIVKSGPTPVRRHQMHYLTSSKSIFKPTSKYEVVPVENEFYGSRYYDFDDDEGKEKFENESKKLPKEVVDIINIFKDETYDSGYPSFVSIYRDKRDNNYSIETNWTTPDKSTSRSAHNNALKLLKEKYPNAKRVRKIAYDEQGGVTSEIKLK